MEVLRFALLGLGVGMAYVLMGQGIVLIYRGSGLVNFAQGAVAMVVAQVFYALKDDGVGTPVALAVSALVAVSIGAAMHNVVLRHMRSASPLVKVIATLGLLTVLQGLGQVVWGPVPRPVSGILPTGYVDFGGGLVIGQDRIVLIGLGLALTLGLWAVYGRTRYGLATSAIAENQPAAVVLGWSPNMIATANWMIGSLLAGLAGILLAPLAGLSVTALVLSVIPGLAAALVGRFSSFWLTLAGGLAIGVTQSEVTRFVRVSGWSDAIPFLFIIVLMVVRGRALPVRGELTERPVRVGSGRLRPGLLSAAVVAVSAVTYLASGEWTLALTSTLLMGILALSLVVLSGYAGQLSLAQVAIAGIGALAAGNASYRMHLPFELSVVFGTLVAALSGLLVALPALRCRGINLAVVTIGLSIVIQTVVLSNPRLAGAAGGLPVESPTLFGISVDSVAHPVRFPLVVLLGFVICAVVVANIRRGRSGLRLLALRSNETAASTVGVNVLAGKTFAFCVSAAIAGFAGALGAFQFSLTNVAQFDTLSSINLTVQTVVGGLGYVGGAVFGGLAAPGGVVSQVLLSFDGDWSQYVTMVSGILVILTILGHQNGVTDSIVHYRPSWLARSRRPAEPRTAGVTVVAEDARPAGAPLTVTGLSVSFGGVTAVRDVSIRVAPGEVVGLIGPNGAGKSTLIDAVTGLVRARGRVLVGDRPLHGLSPRRRSAAGLARTFQSVELFDDMSVHDNIKVAAESGELVSYARDLVAPGQGGLPPIAWLAIQELGLTGVLDRMPDELPAGTRKLVGIARALATTPAVLLLDEPAAGLNDAESQELGQLIRRLSIQWNLAILLVEHDVALVSTCCDRVVAMALGEVVAEGSPREVFSAPAVVSAYLGIDDTGTTGLVALGEGAR